MEKEICFCGPGMRTQIEHQDIHPANKCFITLFACKSGHSYILCVRGWEYFIHNALFQCLVKARVTSIHLLKHSLSQTPAASILVLLSAVLPVGEVLGMENEQ